MDFPGSVLAASCWHESFWDLWNLMVWLSLLYLLPRILDSHIRICFIIARSCWRRATGFSWIEGWSLHVHWTLLSVAIICKGKNSHQILTSVITSYINGVPLVPKDLLPPKCHLLHQGFVADHENVGASQLKWSCATEWFRGASEHCWISQ